MAKTQEIKIKIRADGARAAAGIGKVTKSLGKLKPSFAQVRTGALLFSAAVLGTAAAIYALTRSAANAYDKIQKFSDQLGVSTEFLSKMQMAADFSGMQIEGMNKSIQKMTIAIGEADMGLATYKVAFDNLGVSLRNTEGQLKTSEEIFLEMTDAFSKLTDSTQKAHLAYRVFGARGMQMLQIMKDGREGIEAMWKEAEKFGLVVSEKAGKNAAEFNDSLTRLQGSFRGVKNAIAEDLMPTFTGLQNFLATFIAENRKEIVNFALDFITSLGSMAESVLVGGAEILDFFTKLRIGIVGTRLDFLKVDLRHYAGYLKEYSDEYNAFTKARSNLAITLAHGTQEEIDNLKEVIAKNDEGARKYIMYQTEYEKLHRKAGEAREELNKLTGEPFAADQVKAFMNKLKAGMEELKTGVEDIFTGSGADGKGISGQAQNIGVQIQAQIDRMKLSAEDLIEKQAEKWEALGAQQILIDEWVHLKKGKLAEKTAAEEFKRQEELSKRIMELKAQEAEYQRLVYEDSWAQMIDIANAVGGEQGAGLGQMMAGLKGISDIEAGIDPYSKRLEQIQEFLAAKKSLFLEGAISEDLMYQYFADKAIERERIIGQQKLSMTLSTFSVIQGAMASFASFSDKNSKAMFLASKAVGIAMIWVQTQIAAMSAAAAVAGIPIVGPALAAAAYAKMQTLGYISMAAAAAAAVGQMAAGRGGVGGGLSGGGGYSYTSPTEPSWEKTEEVKQGQVINVHVYGNVVDHDEFARELIESISKAESDGVH